MADHYRCDRCHGQHLLVMEYVDLWLDDVRPAPIGWVWAKTVGEAKIILLEGNVRKCSLDHDLGACEDCLAGRTPEQWLVENDYQAMPNCTHFGTGRTLLDWMEENNIWTKERPTVHSRNPVGRQQMEVIIAKRYDKED